MRAVSADFREKSSEVGHKAGLQRRDHEMNLLKAALVFALTASITVASLQAQEKKVKRSDLSPAVEKTMAEQMNEEAVAP